MNRDHDLHHIYFQSKVHLDRFYQINIDKRHSILKNRISVMNMRPRMRNLIDYLLVFVMEIIKSYID